MQRAFNVTPLLCFPSVWLWSQRDGTDKTADLQSRCDSLWTSSHADFLSLSSFYSKTVLTDLQMCPHSPPTPTPPPPCPIYCGFALNLCSCQRSDSLSASTSLHQLAQIKSLPLCISADWMWISCNTSWLLIGGMMCWTHSIMIWY